jgi:predicted nucleotidyltransferase
MEWSSACSARSIRSRAADCAYFVAGATARDLILVNVHGLRPGRATRDIDFGIAVESWDQFALLKERLVATGGFASDRRALQRLIYSDQATGISIPIDLILFAASHRPAARSSGRQAATSS